MKLAIILGLSLLVISCSKPAAPVANTTKPINAAEQTNEAKSLLAHSSESGTPKPVSPAKPAQGGGDPIDTTKFDEAIAKAEKEMKAKSSDETKKALAEAYFERGFALTEARQYASALGDYRRALKLDPDHEESKKWSDEIERIYAMLKKAPPKEGEEPKPLPFKKEA